MPIKRLLFTKEWGNNVNLCMFRDGRNKYRSIGSRLFGVWSLEQSADSDWVESVFSGMLMRLYSNVNSLLTTSSTATHFHDRPESTKRGAAMLKPLLSIIDSTLQLRLHQAPMIYDHWNQMFSTLTRFAKDRKIGHKSTKYALKYDLCLRKTPFIKWENLF